MPPPPLLGPPPNLSFAKPNRSAERPNLMPPDALGRPIRPGSVQLTRYVKYIRMYLLSKTCFSRVCVMPPVLAPGGVVLTFRPSQIIPGFLYLEKHLNSYGVGFIAYFYAIAHSIRKIGQSRDIPGINQANICHVP